MQCYHKAIKACWGFQLFNILDVFWRGWPTDWMLDWIHSLSWGQAVARPWQKAEPRGHGCTDPAVSLSRKVNAAGCLLHEHSSANRACQGVFASFLRQTADDKMEEQTHGTKAGINWQHLRCVLKQIHRMRLCTSTFSCYQHDKGPRK